MFKGNSKLQKNIEFLLTSGVFSSVKSSYFSDKFHKYLLDTFVICGTFSCVNFVKRELEIGFTLFLRKIF